MINIHELGTIGYDRITMEVGIKAIDTAKMKGEHYSIGYASSSDIICTEILDKADNTMKRIKNLKAIYKIDGCVTSDNEKDSIKYGVTVKQKKSVATGYINTVATLDIVMGRVAYGTTHNVYNVHDNATAEKTLNRVAKELALNGIELDEPNNWIIISAEGNKTVETEYGLNYYNSIFEWAFDKLYESERYRQDNRVRNRNKDGSTSLTYSCRTNRRKIKFYDKTAHLKDTLNIYIDNNLIRCEIKWNREGIERAFGTDKALDVLCNMDRLEEAYNRAIDEMCEVIRKEAEKEIDYLYREFTKANFKEMNRVFTTNATKIFDIVFLLEAGRKAYKDYKATTSNFARDVKKLLYTVDPNLRYKYKDLLYILTAFRSGATLIPLSKATDKYNYV